MISAPIAAQLLNNSINASAENAVKPAMMSTQQIDTVSKNFESMFVSQMLDSMFKDAVGPDAFGDAESADIYRGMMTDAFGKEIANGGGIGIAPYIRKELLKLQEKQP